MIRIPFFKTGKKFDLATIGRIPVSVVQVLQISGFSCIRVDHDYEILFVLGNNGILGYATKSYL
jgi:hypothetical protein